MSEQAETFTEEVRHDPSKVSLLEILGVTTRLGLTSFGGPIAHLGYFHEEYVNRKRWVDEQSYAELVALCQSLPGPTSSMVGTAIGLVRAGLPGGLLAWLGFTLPSALALVTFAYGVTAFGVESGAGWLHGLKVVAVAVVAQAVWGMARTLCPDRERATLGILTAIVALAWPTALGQVLPIIIAGLIGWRLFPPANTPPALHIRVPISRWVGMASWVLFFGLLLALPLVRQVVTSQAVAVFDGFFRSGALVFGGGHVVLPLLQAEVVAPGWVTNEQFVAGYGAAQAVPGPLFTFSAYLGFVMQPQPNGLAGAALGAHCDLPPRHSDDGWCAAILGIAPYTREFPICATRRQRGCGRTSTRGLLPSCVDERDLQANGFRARHPRFWIAGFLEVAALAGGCADRCRRRSGSSYLRKPRTIFGVTQRFQRKRRHCSFDDKRKYGRQLFAKNRGRSREVSWTVENFFV